MAKRRTDRIKIGEIDGRAAYVTKKAVDVYDYDALDECGDPGAYVSKVCMVIEFKQKNYYDGYGLVTCYRTVEEVVGTIKETATNELSRKRTILHPEEYLGGVYGRIAKLMMQYDITKHEKRKKKHEDSAVGRKGKRKAGVPAVVERAAPDQARNRPRVRRASHS